MPTGMHVNRHARPTGMPVDASLGSVKPSRADLDRMEERLRAHVRKHMETEGLGPSAVADATGMDQPYVTKWLKKSGTSRTGLSARQAFRIMHGLGIQAWTFFNKDPEDRYWETYVPHATDGPPRSQPQASTAPAHPSRQTRGGGAR